MDFQESQEYLLSLGFELSVKKFGLENTEILLDALGHPERRFLKVQVAGTNGKGSVCAFLESILLAAGYKVGLNTSPHLVSVTERVRVGGRDISNADFARIATKVRTKGEELVREGTLKALPTYFEHLTAIALLAFAESAVDVAVLETGLGGRFDATTAARSEIAVITPIDLDHMNILGPTIAAIASEKAAIIRPDTDVVISPQHPEALEVLDEKCEDCGIEPMTAESIRFEQTEEGIVFSSDGAEYGPVRLSLAGDHQIGNAATAISAAELLRRRGLRLRDEDIARGLSTAVHRGRLEWRDGILFDGAHNVSGAKALRRFIESNVGKPITMMFAAMEGKDLTEISKILFPLAERLIFVRPSNPRAMKAVDLVRFVPDGFPGKNVFTPSSVGEAVALANQFKREGTMLVTGSLYLIGDVQAYLLDQSVAVRKKQ